MPSDSRIGKSDRQALILQELRQLPSLRVVELAGRLDVSTETIRRDLDALTAQGLLSRTYGGAVRTLETEPVLNERHKLLAAERERIARATMPLIQPGNVLLIGSGSTTQHVARRIALERRDLTVITHSFGVAMALADNPTIRTLLTPGLYNPQEGCTYGAHTVSFLDGFLVDRAILGASGITSEGPSDANAESAAVYSAMMASAATTTIVADHSKVDRLFLARYARWHQIDSLISDKPLPEVLADRLALQRVTVTIAS